MSGRAGARERLPWPPRSVPLPSVAAREKWAAISRPNVSPILYGLLELGARTSPTTRRTSSRHERKKGTAATKTTTLFVLHLSSLPLAFCQQHSPPPHSLLLPHSFKSGSVSVCMSVAVSAISFLQVSNSLPRSAAVAKGPARYPRLPRIAVAFIVVCALHKQRDNEFARPTVPSRRTTATYRLIVATPSHGCCPRHNIGSSFSLLSSPPISREALSPFRRISGSSPHHLFRIRPKFHFDSRCWMGRGRNDRIALTMSRASNDGQVRLGGGHVADETRDAYRSFARAMISLPRICRRRHFFLRPTRSD